MYDVTAVNEMTWCNPDRTWVREGRRQRALVGAWAQRASRKEVGARGQLEQGGTTAQHKPPGARAAGPPPCRDTAALGRCSREANRGTHAHRMNETSDQEAMTRTPTAEPRGDRPSLRPLTDAERNEPVEGTGSRDALLRRNFAEVCREADAWPLPGQGNTELRLELLATNSARDVVLGRLVEAHADAVAILYELRTDVDLLPTAGTSRRWGVWAAGPPESVVASHGVDGWRVFGTKRWCSGAGLVTHALLDAASPDGQRLFEVDLSHHGVLRAASDWTGPGMGRADTRRVDFLDVPARAVGGPGDYLSRPGFWAGAIGVAACWHGGTVAVADALRSAAQTKKDAHALVHLGATYAALLQNRSTLREAARSIDGQPTGDFAVLARTVRFTVERNAVAVIDRVGRALGPGPLAHDERHAQAVHDLQVYIRQDHAERDLERLGRDLLEGDVPWSF